MEELEASIREEKASWKAGRDIFWGSTETENWQHLSPFTRRPLPLCYLRLMSLGASQLVLISLLSCWGLGTRGYISQVEPNIWRWRHGGKPCKNDSWIPCPVSIIMSEAQILPENTPRKVLCSLFRSCGWKGFLGSVAWLPTTGVCNPSLIQVSLCVSGWASLKQTLIYSFWRNSGEKSGEMVFSVVVLWLFPSLWEVPEENSSCLGIQAQIM